VIETCVVDLFDVPRWSPGTDCADSDQLCDDSGGAAVCVDGVQQLFGRGEENGFGTSVAIDGDTLVIGSPYDTIDGVGGRGSAYVFTRTGGIWSFQAQLVADDGLANDWFGYSVAISGNTIVVGAAADDANDLDTAGQDGSAYLFVRDAGRWTQQAKLVASPTVRFANYGSSVAIDRDDVVVGAPVSGASWNGAVYMYHRTGSAWTEEARWNGTYGTSYLGRSVSIDGGTAAVGADGELAAYVYVRDAGGWSFEQRIPDPEGGLSGGFGRSVSISGERIAIGAYATTVDEVGTQGTVYLYTRIGGVWLDEQTLVASDGVLDLRYGYTVALDEDQVAVSPNYAQAVYVYSLVDGVWTDERRITTDEPECAAGFFGTALALDGETLLVGAPNCATGASRLGRAFVGELDLY
jgi:hypothetical protein